MFDDSEECIELVECVLILSHVLWLRIVENLYTVPLGK